MGLIVLSNREPAAPTVLSSGLTAWLPSVGGLTSALDPALREVGGTWIAWGERLPEVRRVALPVTDPRYTVERLALSPEEVRAYYHGFANGALWPLCHSFLERARFVGDEWRAYRDVNARFAGAALEAARPGDVFWVHDYHLALVPGLLRAARPDARIGVFWHIPWPAHDLFRTLPWDADVLRGLLGADLIGMHTAAYVRAFQDACEAVLGAETEPGGVRWEGRVVRVEARPIGLDVEAFAGLAGTPEVEAHAARLRENFRTAVLLGVDRLDYTKGIPERLEAFGAFLDARPEMRGRVTLVQIAVPSREEVESYARLRDQVEGLVGRINGRHAGGGWTPVHYTYRGLPREELVAHYRAADVMLVTPLRDGLNLVAKEFAACSRDGVLLVSRFAGADAELPEAIHVNPYDREGLAEQIARAVEMPLEEKRARLSRLQARLRANDLKSWTTAFVRDLGAPRLPPELVALGARPLLVLCDYDGTVAPIAPTPREADPQPGAREAFSALLHRPGRRVAIVTGRRSAQVYGFLPIPDLDVVGLHGMEWPHAAPPEPDRAALAFLARQVPTLHGLRLEDKRWTLAVHYRNVDPLRQAEVEARLKAIERPEGWEFVGGKKVVEFRPAGYGKGRATERLVAANPGCFPVFLGDDETDEAAFEAVQAAGGIGVKVGEGESVARCRLADPAAVVALLEAWGRG